MNKKTKFPLKTIGLLLTALLLFSLNINNVFSAGILLAPKTATSTSTPSNTPTQTLTRTPTPTRTNTSTNTPITYTVTASPTPGPGMQLISLSPNLTTGLYSSYTLDSSPGIGVSTNELYTWMTVSGTTTSTGDFSRATFIPAIKNNRSTTFRFYWAAWFEVTGFSDVVYAHFGWDHEFSAGYYVTGSGTISPNGTWSPDIGIVKKNLSACHNCSYTLYTTIHFSEKTLLPSPFTSTPTKTPTITPTATRTLTPTITATATFTPTATSTNTFVPGTPHSGGSGTCWASGASWPGHTVYYDIDLSSIPSDWVIPIHNSADTWTNVTPSGFTLNRLLGTDNVITRGYLADQGQYALTSVYASPTVPISKVTTVISDTKPFDVGSPPASGNYSLANVMTHEFGHWLYLKDIYDTSCNQVTMYAYVPTLPAQEEIKITLDSADENATNWQYP